MRLEQLEALHDRRAEQERIEKELSYLEDDLLEKIHWQATQEDAIEIALAIERELGARTLRSLGVQI